MVRVMTGAVSAVIVAPLSQFGSSAVRQFGSSAVRQFGSSALRQFGTSATLLVDATGAVRQASGHAVGGPHYGGGVTLASVTR